MRNTKQYIGVFIFLFAILLLVYALYYFLGTGKEDIDDMKAIMAGEVRPSSDDEDFEAMLEVENDEMTDEEIINDLFADSGDDSVSDIEEDENLDEDLDEDLFASLEEEEENEDIVAIVPEEEIVEEEEPTVVEIVEEEPIESPEWYPNDVVIWDAIWLLVNESELIQIRNIYEILWFENDYPVYSFDGDIMITGLSDKVYEDEYDRITGIINMLDGTVAQTNLFGQKQFFINIPTYYKKKVVMFVESRMVNYIVILDYDIYQEKKEFLGNLFSK